MLQLSASKHRLPLRRRLALLRLPLPRLLLRLLRRLLLLLPLRLVRPLAIRLFCLVAIAQHLPLLVLALAGGNDRLKRLLPVPAGSGGGRRRRGCATFPAWSCGGGRLLAATRRNDEAGAAGAPLQPRGACRGAPSERGAARAAGGGRKQKGKRTAAPASAA